MEISSVATSVHVDVGHEEGMDSFKIAVQAPPPVLLDVTWELLQLRDAIPVESSSMPVAMPGSPRGGTEVPHIYVCMYIHIYIYVSFSLFPFALPFDLSWQNLIYGPGPRVISFVLNASINTLQTPDLLRLWGYKSVSSCDLCGAAQCTLHHILSNYHCPSWEEVQLET